MATFGDLGSNESPNLASPKVKAATSLPPPTPTLDARGSITQEQQAAQARRESSSHSQQQQQQQAAGAQHKRVYQACIPCRRRKVRCDLGSVDNPHDPPCVRCRRESKECFFSATRRKRKTEDGHDVPEEPEPSDDYIVRNGRKRVNTTGSATAVPVDKRLYSDVPLTPGGSIGRNKPLPRPGEAAGGGREGVTPGTTVSTDGTVRLVSDHAGAHGDEEEPNTQVENREAQDVLRTGVFGHHDALDLLYKAATDNASAQKRQESAASLAALQQQAHVITPGVPSAPPQQRGPPPVSIAREPQPIDPKLEKRDLTADPGYPDAVRAWSRFRFVRAGWFTPHEAIEYIDYYYEYLSPLTPISPPTFRNPSSHLTLLTEEPILTVTLLTIASRYMTMPGTGGHCRSHAIHEKLWSYLRGMVERCLWGQETFGGGFVSMPAPASFGGNGEDQGSSTSPTRGMRKGSLRTLGTIESLMILTEWHPRALHFPPEEATDELMLPSYDGSDMISTDENGMQRPSANIGGRRLESWLEPAWRSDRMCWMLLSTAMGLGYELGVFDDMDELLKDGGSSRPEYADDSYRHRANRIKRLLLIYLSQLAGRLGWTNMVPETLRKSDPAVSKKRRPTTGSGSGSGGGTGTTPATDPSSLSNAFNYVPDLELDDQIIHCWAGISNAMYLGNEKLFRSRQLTAEIIRNGKYTELLNEFRPLLANWYKEFEQFRLPPFIRHILTIEYEYVRIYVNSLSLQAVVERSATHAGHTVLGGQTGLQAGSAAQMSPQTQNYFGKLPLGQLGGFGALDQDCIKEVVDGCRKLLRTVVDGLLPGDYLKHCPVRTYFRIISGAMFLLKTFALGASRSDVKVSIDLMDSTVEALRNCVVDDVHLGIRFADLLESLTGRLRNRFIQAPALGHSGDARSPDPHGTGVNGAGGNAPGDWSGHANRLRDGLNASTDLSANISATPFDLSAGNFPYPSGAASGLNPSTPAAGVDAQPHHAPGAGGSGDNNQNSLFDTPSDWANPNNEMWYLPPGPAFFQNMDGGVAMTAEGLNIGGVDLLEYMAMDQPFAMDGSAFP